jgi:hypothetical protein
MNYLVFVNGLGPNYKGDNIYEFIFSNTLKVWGVDWESRPSNGYPSPPDLQYIKRVGVLRNTDIEMDLIQDSDFFSMMDAIDDVISLAWEKETENGEKRLVFRFGEDELTIKNKLLERDLELEYEKKLIYEDI